MWLALNLLIAKKKKKRGILIWKFNSKTEFAFRTSDKLDARNKISEMNCKATMTIKINKRKHIKNAHINQHKSSIACYPLDCIVHVQRFIKISFVWPLWKSHQRAILVAPVILVVLWPVRVYLVKKIVVYVGSVCFRFSSAPWLSPTTIFLLCPFYHLIFHLALYASALVVDLRYCLFNFDVVFFRVALLLSVYNFSFDFQSQFIQQFNVKKMPVHRHNLFLHLDCYCLACSKEMNAEKERMQQWFYLFWFRLRSM